MVAILGYSREQILAAVKDMYTAVAESPTSHFHFPVGRSACRVLGYDEANLDRLPRPPVESFAGVGCPFRANAIGDGDTVLDIGAGAGVDTFLSSRLVGPDGHVVALDLTPAMTRKLADTAAASGISNVSVTQASAERLPLADESVDVITSNGALNLVPDKRRAVAEMFRVLRPGGRLQIADVVIQRPVTVDCDDDPRLWVECVVGATVDQDFLTLFEDAGFEDIEIVHEHDYFSHSPSRQTQEVAAGFGAKSIETRMRRAQQPPSRVWQWGRRLDPRRFIASVWRRGFMGVASLILALIACYGILAMVAILPLLGVGIAINESIWAGAIAALTLLAMTTIALGGRRHHRGVGPTGLAVAGAGIIHYALFVEYDMLVELAGFIALGAGAAWDVYLHRRQQQRVLGLDRAGSESHEHGIAKP